MNRKMINQAKGPTEWTYIQVLSYLVTKRVSVYPMIWKTSSAKVRRLTSANCSPKWFQVKISDADLHDLLKIVPCLHCAVCVEKHSHWSGSRIQLRWQLLWWISTDHLRRFFRNTWFLPTVSHLSCQTLAVYWTGVCNLVLHWTGCHIVMSEYWM